MEIVKKIAFLVLFLPQTTFAAINCADSEKLIINPSGGPALSGASVYCLIVRAQNLVLTIAGIAALVMILWGGFTLMTAGGNEERVGKGKKILTYAIGGILLIVFAYALITLYVRVLGGTV